MREKLIILVAGLLRATATVAAPADILLFDDFDSENGGQGAPVYSGFKNWNAIDGNVALLGEGFLDVYPGHGLYVDLGGSSTDTPGALVSKKRFALFPGVSYTLSFELGGNPANPGPADTVRVSLGKAYRETFTLRNADPLAKITRVFTVKAPTGGKLRFGDVGSRGVDSEGLILDNVTLVAVPEAGGECGVAHATANPSTLWPPNHQMVPVEVTVVATEACGPTPNCRIVSVESDEPTDGTGDGDTEPDWESTGRFTLNLRAERSGAGDGRRYVITTQCTDTAGLGSTREVIVTVAHDRGKDK